MPGGLVKGSPDGGPGADTCTPGFADCGGPSGRSRGATGLLCEPWRDSFGFGGFLVFEPPAEPGADVVGEKKSPGDLFLGLRGFFHVSIL